MARKATKAAPKHVEPEDESQDAPEEETERDDQDEPETGGKAMSKAEAIRRALAAGHEGPQDGTAYIRREFGIEITPQHFSATRAQIKSRAAKKQGSGGTAAQAETPKGKPGRKPKGTMQPVQPKSAVPPGYRPPPDFYEDMDILRRLIDKYGKKGLIDWVDFLRLDFDEQD